MPVIACRAMVLRKLAVVCSRGRQVWLDGPGRVVIAECRLGRSTRSFLVHTVRSYTHRFMHTIPLGPARGGWNLHEPGQNTECVLAKALHKERKKNASYSARRSWRDTVLVSPNHRSAVCSCHALERRVLARRDRRRSAKRACRIGPGRRQQHPVTRGATGWGRRAFPGAGVTPVAPIPTLDCPP